MERERFHAWKESPCFCLISIWNVARARPDSILNSAGRIILVVREWVYACCAVPTPLEAAHRPKGYDTDDEDSEVTVKQFNYNAADIFVSAKLQNGKWKKKDDRANGMHEAAIIVCDFPYCKLRNQRLHRAMSCLLKIKTDLSLHLVVSFLNSKGGALPREAVLQWVKPYWENPCRSPANEAKKHDRHTLKLRDMVCTEKKKSYHLCRW